MKRIELIFSLLLSGCTLIQSSPSTRPLTESQDPVFKISELNYQSIHTQVLEPKCIECHSQKGGNEGKVNLESYAQVMLNLDEVRTDVEDGSMPKNRAPLSAFQKKLILKWIEIGAPELSLKDWPSANGPTEPQPQTPTVLDYATVKEKVLDPKCVKCHSESGGNRGDVNLETYAKVIEQIQAVRESVIDGSMPKKGQLTEAQKNLILSWIDQGAPETQSSTGHGIPPSPKLDAFEPAVDSLTPFQMHGRYIYKLSGCANCHTSEPSQPLAGGVSFKTDFGVFYAPNISPHRKNGIGQWTESQFIRSLRHGISPEGNYYYPTFPYNNYTFLTDRDLKALYSYLLLFPPQASPSQAHDLKPFFAERKTLFFWRLLFFKESGQGLAHVRGPYRNDSSESPLWNRGAYLVESALHCTQCHTERNLMGGFKTDKWMAGAPLPGTSYVSPNITSAPLSGLGSWSNEDWRTFFKSGKNPKGVSSGGEMKAVLKNQTSHLNEKDLDAVILYLRSLAPVENEPSKTTKSGKPDPDFDSEANHKAP